jgi:RNA polymerase sigma-70 factor (ECF subfamily)
MTNAVQSGKREKFARWVEDYGDALYSWAALRVSDEATAQDLVQETFVAAFLQIDSFREESSAKTWLSSILNNKIIDHFRQQARQADFEKLPDFDVPSMWFDNDGQWKEAHRPQAWDESEALLDDPEFEKVLGLCLAKLPSVWRACLELKYLEAKDSSAICQELEISATNFWQMVHRAKLQVRHCLEKGWFKSLS